VESRAEEYRRRAERCLEMGPTFHNPQARDVLLQMAQVWQRLADAQNDVPDLAQTPAPPPAAEQIRPVVQQQQPRKGPGERPPGP